MNHRRRTIALVSGLLALAACGNDDPDDVGPPPSSDTVLAAHAARDATVAGARRPIVVADAYHGVGVVVCPDGTQPTNVADGYHGVGVTLCL